METNARYLYVGAFVLGSFVLALFFVLWIGKDSLSHNAKPFIINFEESVVGLKEGAQVLYHGVPVGMVQTIGLNPKNQSLVSVKVELDSHIAITQGTEATLRSQGITGLTYIEIMGSKEGSAPLGIKKGNHFPEIPAIPSRIESLMQSAPDLVSALDEVARGTAALVNKENREHVTHILKAVDRISTTLMERADALPKILADTERTLKSIDDTAQAYHKFISEMDKELLHS